jgi:uroporphyrinogen decarboxylase
MTPRERAHRAMTGGDPGRTPVVPLIDTSYAAACAGVPVSRCFLDAEAHARALVATLERHPGIDGLSVNIGLEPGQIETLAEEPEGFRIAARDGVEWWVPLNDVGTPARRGVTNLEDERLRTGDSFRPHILRTLASIPAHIRRYFDISAGLTGPYSQVAFVLGLEATLVAMHEQPEALHRAIAARVDFTLAWAEEMARLDAASIWIGEGFASGSLISPAQYREFAMPYQAIVCRRLRELGTPSVIHICGKTAKMLEAIAETGADCFEIDWQVPLEEAARRIGARMCLKGNLHTTRLIHSSAARIEQEAREAIRQAAGARYILSSGCAVGRDTPPGNIDAMVRAAAHQ